MRAFLSKRPLIVLLALYVIALVVLDAAGCFRPRLPPALAPSSLPREAEIEGRAAEPPEQRPGRFSFPLELSTLDASPCMARVLVSGYGAAPDLRAGDIVRIRCLLREPAGARNPGCFDYAKFLSRQGIAVMAYPRSFEITGHRAPPWYLRAAKRVHDDIAATVEANLPEREAAVLIPMLIGGKEGLAREIKDDFTDAGVMHTLVVSGFNVAYVSGIFLLLFRAVGFNRRLASLLTMPFLFLYLLVVGDNPPALRATVMAFSIILSMSLDREPLIYQSLALAAAVILLFDPQALFSASFQLSFAATVGIVYLYPLLMEPFKAVPRWLANTLLTTIAVSLAAQLAVLPVLAYYFNRVSLVGLISNIPIVPLTGIITAGGIVLYLVHFVSPLLALPVAFVLSHLLRLVLFLVHYFAHLPWANLHIATPTLFSIAVYYALFFGIGKLRSSRTFAYVLGFLLLVWTGWHGLERHRARERLETTFLSLGNGEAVHLALPGGRHWLIDGGGEPGSRSDPGKNVLCPYLWSKGITRLDRVVITHPHLPHYSGLATVVKNIGVDEVLCNADVPQNREFTKLMELLKEMKIPVREVWAGDRFAAGGSTITVVSPGIMTGNRDDDTLVLLAEYAGRRILLTNDLGKKAEGRLMSRIQCAVPVVEIPDHGERSFQPASLKVLSPEYCIISGDSRPLEGYGRIFATGRDGAVTVSVDRKGAVQVSTYR